MKPTSREPIYSANELMRLLRLLLAKTRDHIIRRHAKGLLSRLLGLS